MPGFRPNVALALEDVGGNILIGERADAPGSWQFPQGGVQPGETGGAALQREAVEEIDLAPEAYRILESRGPYRYRFPPGRTKEGFAGQEQTCYRAVLRPGYSIAAGPIDSPEFSRLRWIRPEQFQLDWLPPFKRGVYRRFFIEFWKVELGASQP